MFADNADNTAEFLDDLAKLSGQLADSADDILGLADAANAALPMLNDNEAELVTILQQAGRLSNDVADLLLGNKPFVDAVPGRREQARSQLLYDQRSQVVPLVIGLRQYIQTLTEVVRIDVGDGTLMARGEGHPRRRGLRADPVRRADRGNDHRPPPPAVDPPPAG